MTPPAPHADQTDRIREEAAAWLIRLREPGAAAHHPDFETWKASSPAHAAAFEDIRTLFGVFETPARILAQRDAAQPRVVRHAAQRNPRNRWLIAASLLLCTLLGLWQQDRILDLRADAVTAAGETETVHLPDGSTVTLNTRTAIRSRYDTTSRGLQLLHGEAYFDIAKDPSRPFTIEAGTARIRVLGTRFNVRIDDTTVAVAVGEGRVLLSSTTNTTRPITLTADQRGSATPSQVQSRQTADTRDSTAWLDNKVIFFETPLAAVVTELNRYRAAPILILNNKARTRQISGVFNLPDTNNAVTTLERSLGLRSARLPAGLTILY